jgi:hypothetical protein
MFDRSIRRWRKYMFKKLFAVVLVAIFALSVPVVPAFASDLKLSQEPAQFQALSSLPDSRRDQLAAMTDEQLAAVEGAGICVVCVNLALISQANASAFTFKNRQSNSARVRQSIN